MIQKERESQPSGLTKETIRKGEIDEAKIIVPEEYPTSFFEADWRSILKNFTQFLTDLSYQRQNGRKKGLPSSPRRTFEINQNMYYLVEDVNEGVPGEVRCAPILSKAKTMLSKLNYSTRDQSIELTAEFKPSDLSSIQFVRNEIYYPEPKIKDYVKDHSSRTILIPRMNLDIPVPKANNYDHIYLTYYYDLTQDHETPAEISFHMTNQPLKPELDDVDEEGNSSGDSNWLEDISVFRNIELKDNCILVGVDSNTDIHPLVQELIRLLTQRTTGKNLMFESTA